MSLWADAQIKLLVMQIRNLGIRMDMLESMVKDLQARKGGTEIPSMFAPFDKRTKEYKKWKSKTS